MNRTALKRVLIPLAIAVAIGLGILSLWGCGSFWEARSEEDAERAAEAIEVLGELGIHFLTPAQAWLGNIITAFVTAAGVMLRRNATRRRVLEEVKHHA